MSQDPRNMNIGAMTGNTFSDQQLETIFDTVVTGPKAHNPTMSENTFKNYFLPVLAGTVVDPERLRLYIQGGGGPNVGVNIIDEQGVFLFEVPPFISTEHIKALPEDRNAKTFTDIVDHVELMRHRSAIQAQALFRNAIHDRVIKAHIKGYRPTANELRWIEIFKKYGYEVKQPEILSKENRDKLTATNLPASAQSPGVQGADDNIETIGEF